VDEEEEGREEEHDEVHRVVGVTYCVEQHIEPNKTAESQSKVDPSVGLTKFDSNVPALDPREGVDGDDGEENERRVCRDDL